MTTADRLAAALADVERLRAEVQAHNRRGITLRESYARALIVLAQLRDEAMAA